MILALQSAVNMMDSPRVGSDFQNFFLIVAQPYMLLSVLYGLKKRTIEGIDGQIRFFSDSCPAIPSEHDGFTTGKLRFPGFFLIAVLPYMPLHVLYGLKITYKE